MMMSFYLKIFLFVFIFTLSLPCFCLSLINNRPIIGIVTEEVNTTFAPNATSYIMASYVKFLEAGGARVVPVMIFKPKEYYQALMSKINGILFPGGGGILQSNGYGRTGKLIFDIAVEMNDKGDYFPLWGTCLGFELLNLLAAKKNWMKACAAEDLPAHLNFVEGFENSRIFKDLDSSLKNKMQNQNITIHYHQWCLTPSNYSTSHLNEYFKVLATNTDLNGVIFVSVVEAYKYPFYGVTFHPEKVLFEWVLSKTHSNIPHSADAVHASQYFSRFFVNEGLRTLDPFQNLGFGFGNFPQLFANDIQGGFPDFTTSFNATVSTSSNAPTVRKTSTSTRFMNGVKIETKKVQANGVETVTVLEDGVIKSRTVNGVPQPLNAIR